MSEVVLDLITSCQESYDFSSLRLLAFGGGLVPIEKMEIMKSFLQCAVSVVYGITEAGFSFTGYNFTKHELRAFSSGKCSIDTEIKVRFHPNYSIVYSMCNLEF